MIEQHIKNLAGMLCDVNQAEIIHHLAAGDLKEWCGRWYAVANSTLTAIEYEVKEIKHE